MVLFQLFSAHSMGDCQPPARLQQTAQDPNQSLRILKMRESMVRAGHNLILSRQSRLALCEKRLAARHPAALIRDMNARAELLSHRLTALTEKQLTLLSSRLEGLTQKLDALGPRQALSRGYAILLDGKQAVTQVSQAKEEMTVLLQDGRMSVRTLDIRKEDPFGEETDHL